MEWISLEKHYKKKLGRSKYSHFSFVVTKAEKSLVAMQELPDGADLSKVEQIKLEDRGSSLALFAPLDEGWREQLDLSDGSSTRFWLLCLSFDKISHILKAEII